MNDHALVLIADSQFLTRKGISTLVDSLDEFQLIEESATNEGLAEKVSRLKPDLVVMGLTEKSETLLKELSTVSSATNFLVISSLLRRDVLKGLLSMGIKGIVTKNCSEEEITNGMKSVAKGNRFFCNTILDLVVAGPEEEENCEPTNLSPREYEVLSLITKGFKTNQIAETLFLSVHTVNSHRKNILRKLNLKSPAELIVYALETGLVKSEIS